jgi:hypothetical protein
LRRGAPGKKRGSERGYQTLHGKDAGVPESECLALIVENLLCFHNFQLLARISTESPTFYNSRD